MCLDANECANRPCVFDACGKQTHIHLARGCSLNILLAKDVRRNGEGGGRGRRRTGEGGKRSRGEGKGRASGGRSAAKSRFFFKGAAFIEFDSEESANKVLVQDLSYKDDKLTLKSKEEHVKMIKNAYATPDRSEDEDKDPHRAQFLQHVLQGKEHQTCAGCRDSLVRCVSWFKCTGDDCYNCFKKNTLYLERIVSIESGVETYVDPRTHWFCCEVEAVLLSPFSLITSLSIVCPSIGRSNPPLSPSSVTYPTVSVATDGKNRIDVAPTELW